MFEMPNWAINDKETFNYWLSSYWSDYETATYVTADTAKSYEFFYEYYEANKNNGNDEYSVAFNNCSQIVVDGLKEATLYDGTSMSDYLGFVPSLLPKAAMSDLSEKFYNNSWNYESYIKNINDQLWEARNGQNKSRSKAKDLEKLYYKF